MYELGGIPFLFFFFNFFFDILLAKVSGTFLLKLLMQLEARIDEMEKKR